MRGLLVLRGIFNFFFWLVFASSPVSHADEAKRKADSVAVTCRVLNQENGTVTQETMQFSDPEIVKNCKDHAVAFIRLPDVEKAPGAAPIPIPEQGDGD